MKKLLSLLLALLMLCSCGRAVLQKESLQPEAPEVSEEQPVETEESTTEAETPKQEEENPNTDPQPSIENSQPPVEIIHLPSQEVELSPTPLREEEKLNPNTNPGPSMEDVQKEVSEQESYNGPAIGSFFDLSVLDDLQDFHHAIYTTNIYLNNKLVDTDHHILETAHQKIISEIIEELKDVLDGSIVIEPTVEWETQLFQPEMKGVWFRAKKKPYVYVYPNFTCIEHNENKYYLNTNEEQYYALAELVKRYDESGYDTDRMALHEMSFHTLDGATIYYNGEGYQFDDETRKAFLGELTKIVNGKGSIFSTEEIKQAYLNKDYWATIEHHQHFSSEYHFGDGFILLEGDSNLQFYYAGNIQDELHELFKKYCK